MRETSIGCLLHVPIRAPGPKCRHVSRVGIELVTICVAAQCPAWSGLQTYFKSPQTLRVGRFVFSELVALRATWNSKGLSRPAPMSCIQGTVSHHEPWQETRQTKEQPREDSATCCRGSRSGSHQCRRLFPAGEQETRGHDFLPQESGKA